jgi:hypothetical protein
MTNIKSGDLATANIDKWEPSTWPAEAKGVAPVEAPTLKVVAAPNALTVVAVVLNTAMVALPAKMLVVIVGPVPNTSAPVPVSSVTALIRLALEGVARNVATPAARPDTPVLIGSPVQLVSVPDDGVPRTGVTSVGLVANTSAPVPVSFVTAARRFAELGVARNVATPVPRPETPVEIGRPVALVSVPLAGVPRTGAVIVGLVSVLFVSVSVVARPTRVSVASGKVTTRPAVETASSNVIALAAAFTPGELGANRYGDDPLRDPLLGRK